MNRRSILMFFCSPPGSDGSNRTQWLELSIRRDLIARLTGSLHFAVGLRLGSGGHEAGLEDRLLALVPVICGSRRNSRVINELTLLGLMPRFAGVV